MADKKYSIKYRLGEVLIAVRIHVPAVGELGATVVEQSGAFMPLRTTEKKWTVQCRIVHYVQYIK